MSTLRHNDLREIEELNRLRGLGESQELSRLEASLEERFGAASRLAVYGTLAPGRMNHHVLEPLGGEWFSGLTVTGDLVTAGWGAELGYPALRWLASGPKIPVELLVSSELPLHWSRLDAFEGSEYRRILVPIYNGQEISAIGNLYAVAETPPAA